MRNAKHKLNTNSHPFNKVEFISQFLIIGILCKTLPLVNAFQSNSFTRCTFDVTRISKRPFSKHINCKNSFLPRLLFSPFCNSILSKQQYSQHYAPLKASPSKTSIVSLDEDEDKNISSDIHHEEIGEKVHKEKEKSILNMVNMDTDPSFFTVANEYNDDDNEFYDLEDEDEDEDEDEEFEDQMNHEIDPGYEEKIFTQYDDKDENYHDGHADHGESSVLYNRDLDLIEEEREDRLFSNAVKEERCILVAVEDLAKSRRARNGNLEGDIHSGVLSIDIDNENWDDDSNDDSVYFSIDESMNEMRELIKTAGLTLVGEVTQRLNEPVPRTYVGTGKLQEVKECMDQHEACTVVFDAELSPRQQKALENKFNKETIQNDFLGSENAEVKVLDRTALILDIFAQHAKTREGKLQVDLALHQYRKPRLTKMWTHLERQSGAGGVGLRGPGESQLEIDKRLIRDRIIVLQRKIDNVQKQRDLHRRGRDKAGLPILAVVGYTNAGKSTLLNYLTRAGVMAENILFATLDPTTRKVKLPGYKTHPEVLLTDTVGFIQALPTQLIAAFRATLEEVVEADVLIHVIDINNPSWRKQEQSVLKTLNEIDAGEKPMVRVFNKIDLLDKDVAEDLKYEAAGSKKLSVAISALSGDGMQDFVSVVEDALSELLVPIEVEIPFSKGEELNLIHEVGAVDTIDYRATGTYVYGKVPETLANRLKPYYVNELGHNESDENGENEEEIDWVALGRGRHKKKKH